MDFQALAMPFQVIIGAIPRNVVERVYSNHKEFKPIFITTKRPLMVRWRLMQLIGEYEQKAGCRLSFRQIARSTGLAETTVSSLANNASKRADLGTLDKLLTYFSSRLDRTVNVCDLLDQE